MKKSIILLISFLIISGCRDNKVFTVEGSGKEVKQDFIYIRKVEINTTVLTDSARINRKGNFRFRVKAEEPDFYQISSSPDNFITLLAEPGEKIKLNFKGSILYNDYTVTGSKGSEQVQLLDLMLFKTQNKLDSLRTLYNNSSREPGFELKKPLLEQEYANLINEQRKFTIGFILKNMTSLAAVKALYQKIEDQSYVLNQTRDLQYMKIVSDSLKKYFPNSKHTKALVSDFTNEMNQLYSRQLSQLSNSLPETKLDPSLKDINGRRVTLSSLKGKYVLLTFWSAGSRECIVENLQLKEFYKNYKKKGFEIYQINLDQDESTWKNAVKFDELPWISTREDDPSNPKNAMLYNVKSVPVNYLYDPKGNIIASNLHGKSLQLKLDQLFK